MANGATLTGIFAQLPGSVYGGATSPEPILTGSFIVENIFQIPGIGVFLVNSSLNRDYTMVVGLVFLYAALLLILYPESVGRPMI